MHLFSSKRKSTFYCFTPEVSLVTFFIEFLLAGYIFFRYRLNQFGRIAILLLLGLGTFQLAEYMMCTGNNTLMWGKIGAAAITLLPVMAVHLVTMITRKSIWTEIGYVMGGAIIIAIFFTSVLQSIGCTGHYVAINFDDWFSILFNGYYGFFILIGIEMAVRTWLQHRGDKKELFWIMLIYASFLIPTAIVYFLFITAREGTPSIMCGFAVFGALILVFKEIPRVYAVGVGKRAVKGRKKR